METDLRDDQGASLSRRFIRWLPAALAMLVSLIPVRGALSTSEIFYVRDIALYFWPEHLWLRKALSDGVLPLWDPFVAFGQSAVADPMRHVLCPLTLPLRLLPDPIGFNLICVLPLPLAAWACYRMLRAHVSRGAAALGGAAFALSGPMATSANMPNLAWTAALMPLALFTARELAARPTLVRFALLAVVLALQVTTGEPVTLVATAVLATAYSYACGGRGIRGAFTTLSGGAVAVALAAIQIAPLAVAASRSSRLEGIAETHAIHPLALVEAVVPQLLIDPFRPWREPSAWQQLLYSGVDPLFYSSYVGIVVVLLAAFALIGPERARGTRFWIVAGATALLFAMGSNTPVLPTIQMALPFLRGFRFPAKYAVVTALALAALAAYGFDAVRRLDGIDRRARATLVGPIAVAIGIGFVVVVSFVLPQAVGTDGSLTWASAAIASITGGSAALARTAVLAAATAALVWVAARRAPDSIARHAIPALGALAVLDLATANASFNPTMDAAILGPPRWAAIAAEAGSGRIYVGGRSFETVQAPDDYMVRSIAGVPDTASFQLVDAVRVSALAVFPSGASVREPISRQTTALWPREYQQIVERFARADRTTRDRFLRRTGTRYYLSVIPPTQSASQLATVPGLGALALYEVEGVTDRARVVTDAVVDSSTTSSFDALFENDERTRIAEEGEAAGRAATPGAPEATVKSETPVDVTIGAVVPEGGGYLVLMDSYDAGWQATVDGMPTNIIRADGVFRAVRLAPGAHEVRFRYRPIELVAGAWVSMLTALALVGALSIVRTRHQTRRRRGLVEPAPSI